MYAVVASGAKQYRVEPGGTLLVERLAGEPGAAVSFDRVLLVGDGERVAVGTPVVSGATVRGTIVGAERGPKIIVFKYRQKARYRRKAGHRQQLTRVRIEAVEAPGLDAAAGGARAEPQPAATAPVEASASQPDTEAPAVAAAPARRPRRRARSSLSTEEQA